MVGRRGRQHRVATQRFVIHEWIVISRRHQRPCRFLKPQSPVERLARLVSPCVRVKIVNQVPAANNEDVLIPERSQPLCKLVMKLGGLRLINA